MKKKSLLQSKTVWASIGLTLTALGEVLGVYTAPKQVYLFWFGLMGIGFRDAMNKK